MGKKKKTNPHNSGEISIAPETGPIRLKNSFFWQWVLFLALSIFFIWMVRLVSTPTFLINDNLAIIAFAENGFLAPYVHFLWSRLLTGLYSLSPQTPWYGLGLYTVHAVSLSIVLTVFYRVISGIGFFFVFTLVALFFWSDMVVRLDYSGASIMIGTSAVFLFFLFHHEDRLNLQTALLPCLVLAFAALPRINGIIAAVAMAAPFLGILFLMSHRQNAGSLKAFSRMAALFALLILPGLMVYSANGVYRDNFLPQDEAAYDKFNLLMGRFDMFSADDENLNNPAIYGAAGWTVGDYLRLQNWMIFDENIYNVETFEKFFAHATVPEKKAVGFGEIISSFSSVMKEFSAFFLLMAGGLALAWGRRTCPFKECILCCLAAAAVLATVSAMEIYLRFPYRIGYPMLFSAGLFLFFLSMAPKKDKPLINDGRKGCEKENPGSPGLWNSVTLKLIFPAAVLLAGLIHGNMLNINYKAVQSHLEFNQMMTRHINNHFPGSFLITEPLLSAFHYDVDPIDPPERKFTRIPLGWSTFSPLFYKTLGEMGLKRGSELAPAMITRDDILVLSRIPWAKLLVNYAYERGLGIPQVEGLAEMGDVGLYRLRK